MNSIVFFGRSKEENKMIIKSNNPLWGHPSLTAYKTLLSDCKMEVQLVDFYRPQTKLGEGNVFIGVCPQGGISGPMSFPGVYGYPRWWVCLHTWGWQGDGLHPTGMLSCY